MVGDVETFICFYFDEIGLEWQGYAVFMIIDIIF